jgi:hypothetical protein
MFNKNYILSLFLLLTWSISAMPVNEMCNISTTNFQKFVLDDFGALNPTVLQKLNSPGVLNNWKKLANVDAVYERKLFDFISNTNRTDTLVQFYGVNPLKLKIQVLDDAKKITFIDNFKNIDPTDFNKFVSNPDLVTHWFKYFDETILRADFISLTKSKQLKFLEDYGNATTTVFNKFIANKNLINTWRKVSENPLNVAVQSTYIKRIDYLELVDNLHKISTVKNGKVITLEHHIAGEMNTLIHNGVEHITGYSGFHFDFKITEANHITPTTTNIGGVNYMTGPIPTSGALNPAAIQSGSSSIVNGVEKAKVLVWGYASRRNLTPPPPFELILDISGNPIKAWVPKRNNQGNTSLFPGWNVDKTFNEIAFARINLNTSDWVRKPGGFSNEWSGFSSDAKKINMYISLGTNDMPLNVPNFSAKLQSAFPKQ